MYSLGMPPNWWWMHAESSELRFPFTGPFGARRWLGHQIQLRHKHCLRRFSVGVWFFLGKRFPNVLFCSIKRCVPLQRPRVSSQRLWRLCSGLGADPYMEWASRSRVFVGLVGALGKHRVPSIQIGGILKLLEKRSSAKRRVTFESTTLQSFRFDVIWRDLMWFVDVCAGWKTLHTIITTDGSQYYINKHWLSQWPSFKLLGITYLVGNIKFKLLFHGPLAE